MDYFSLTALLVNASLFVQIIALTLFVLSVISWGILFYTVFVLFSLKREVHRITTFSTTSEGLERIHAQAQQSNSLTYSVFKRFFALWSSFHAQPEYVLESALIAAEDARNSAGTLVPWLASIASSSPFIGLLGTVWGIMSSFQSIAQTQETHLSVVAPGIAEALAVTAIGLVVAIPATIMYNSITKALDGYTSSVSDLLIQCMHVLKKRDQK